MTAFAEKRSPAWVPPTPAPTQATPTAVPGAVPGAVPRPMLATPSDDRGARNDAIVDGNISSAR